MDKTPKKFLSIELNKSSVKPRKLLLSSFRYTCSSLSCIKTWVSEYKWSGARPYLYSSVELTYNLTGPTCLTDWVDLSSKTLKTTFIIFPLGYYWSELHPEVYIDSFNDSYKTKLISWWRNTINTSRISSEITIQLVFTLHPLWFILTIHIYYKPTKIDSNILNRDLSPS